jgi:predicted permease
MFIKSIVTLIFLTMGYLYISTQNIFSGVIALIAGIFDIILFFKRK